MVVKKAVDPVAPADRFAACGVSAALCSLALAALCGLALAAPASAGAANTPTPGAPYFNGQSGRFTLGGVWFLRRDPGNVGLRQRFQNSRTFSPGAGWGATTVPNSFNAGDYSEASYTGSIAWYATEFNRPKTGRGGRWILRFDSVNYRVRVWLNGRSIGGNTGGYVPFELDAKSIKRGVNRLVIRVESRLGAFSVPSQETRNDQLTGGWWNYGGVLREVILRRAGRVDIDNVATRVRLRGRRGPAKITVVAHVRNTTNRRVRVRLNGRFGRARVSFRRTVLRRGASADLLGSVTVRRPKLWGPGSPNLYKLTVRAPGSSYRARSGIKRLAVSRGGALSLNGKKVRLRGVSYHEADDQVGAAWTPSVRNANLALVIRLGANVIRSHYPLSPATMEWADASGILTWVQAPVFRARETQLKSKRYRVNAVNFTRKMVFANRQYASVLVWSLMNEPVPAGTTNLNKTLSAQISAARRLDPGGLVGADYAGAPEDELQHPAYRKLDVLGVNEYFGWYPGLLGSTLKLEDLAPYLAYLHRAYPRQALFVTEFGAEANRNGSADEVGTYEFQTNFMIAQMRILRAQQFLNGFFAWALKDYPVRPDWSGGNPDPSPPYSKKGLFDNFGNPKPAAAEVEREFKATSPFK
ncbi:MAG: glycoside hydrolase family 2 TIM barrel-domain containing protein [Solirubrobacterales bacterium]